MKHKKFFVMEHTPWTTAPRPVQEFYSRRAAEAFIKGYKGDSKLDIEESMVPAYVPHSGSPGVGDPVLAKRGKPEDPVIPTTPDVTITTGSAADSDPDDEAFTFFKDRKLSALDEAVKSTGLLKGARLTIGGTTYYGQALYEKYLDICLPPLPHYTKERK